MLLSLVPGEENVWHKANLRLLRVEMNDLVRPDAGLPLEPESQQRLEEPRTRTAICTHPQCHPVYLRPFRD